MYLPQENLIWIAQGDGRITMIPKMANRHGLITGATGTGKTVTLKVLAEAFSDMGVPVFLADIKGDVSGMALPGQPNENVDKRVAEFGIQGWSYSAYPVRFWDVLGTNGVPIRTTVSDMGPDLLSRLLELSDVQEEVLAIVFKIADDRGWLLTDTKDLKAMLTWVSQHASELAMQYGAMTAATLATIQRNVVTLEAAGGDKFFGEPALDISDWLALDDYGHGVVNLLYAVELVQNPLLYSTFLLWMLSELYEKLPEAGDLDKPKIVFFFDEAHLLFNDAPKALLTKIEQVARLIRSKAVGIYFVTQSPADIPDTVLAQLGNKIQHALRAYTPADQKAVKAAAQSFRANPAFDSASVIGELGTGEALLSLLDATGAPQMVQRGKILPPRSYMGAASADLIKQRVNGSPFLAKYGTPVDNVSAYEVLTEQAQADQQAAAQAAEQAAADKQAAAQAKADAAAQAKAEKEAQRAAETKAKADAKAAEKRNAQVQRVVVNTASSIGRQLGTQLIRGLFGTRR
ncbi:MAG: DUF853 domain-containing protein [Propionibacteriaceae bacterium]|nr:DUF853 domain-containing protein [Propionibacteriaceae bacterium]